MFVADKQCSLSAIVSACGRSVRFIEIGHAGGQIVTTATADQSKEAIRDATNELEKPMHAEDLPIKGKIEWAQKHLPFVDGKPSAGVSGFGMVVFKGKIYHFGGFIPAGDETQDIGRRTSRWAHVYDPKTDEWTKLPDMPGRREYCSAIAGDKGIYVLGGGVQGKAYKAKADVFFLDLSGKEPVWQEHGQLSSPRTHMACDRIDNKLIAVGGHEFGFNGEAYDPQNARNIVEILDLANQKQGWKLGSPMPHSCGWSASGVIGTKLYAMGGFTGGFTDLAAGRLRENYCYDLATDSWTQLKTFPDYVAGWEGEAYKDRYIICIGGVRFRTDNPQDMIWNSKLFLYDTQDDTWYRMEGDLPKTKWSSNPAAPHLTTLHDPGVCIIGDTIYAAGAEGPEATHSDYFLVGKITLD